MSRSYRKPYAAITGTTSAKRDKIQANRGVRRRQNFYLKCSFRDDSWDDFLIPHRYECSWNDVWVWGRDGKQHWIEPVSRYRPGEEEWDSYMREYWIKIQRK